MHLLGPELHREADCEAILRSLPAWFGIEDSLREYVRDSGLMPSFATEAAGRLRGFITLHAHFPQAWEVHCIAVHADARGQGDGTRLLSHAEDWIRAQGGRFLQIKTIADTKVDAAYEQTRAFYFARGYTPLELFPTLWQPWNPVVQLIKHLGTP